MEETALIPSVVSNMELAALIASIVSILIGVFAVCIAWAFFRKGMDTQNKAGETLAAIQGQVGTTKDLVDTHFSTVVSELAKAPRTTDKLSGLLQQALAKIPVQRPDEDRCAQPDQGTLTVDEELSTVKSQIILMLGVHVADFAAWANISAQFLATTDLVLRPELNLRALADRTMVGFDIYDRVFRDTSAMEPSLLDEIKAHHQEIQDVRQHCRGGEAVARLAEMATRKYTRDRLQR